MKQITDEQIKGLHITPNECIDWVRQSFSMKYDAQLPAKISVHPHGIDFYTSMPCLLPSQYDCFGIKIVSRIHGRKPSLKSDLLLYQASTGEMLAMMDADWITQMRTGAVAALAIQYLQKTLASVYGFVGLGSTAQATMMCLQTLLETTKTYTVKLLRYKDQAQRFAERFASSNIDFQIVDTPIELVENTDVLVSAVTEMPNLFCPEDALFPKGILLVPIHTRGFQNCDLFFDQIVADDRAHVEKFANFNRFRQLSELSDIILENQAGRKNNEERIIAYNIGLGLHDVWFGKKIYERLCC